MAATEKRPLIILTGPTAVGKTALSIHLAREIGGEIISADSMQVYRGMDIGTAKIKPEQMQGVTHHLIDILDPDEAFSVSVFQNYCKQAMEAIYDRGKIPILVGGTGFYIRSVLYDTAFEQTEADCKYREELAAFAAEKGADALHQKLTEVDPNAAQAIHPNNIKRVIRALEYYEQTGKRISEHNELERQRQSPYRFRYYVISLPRSVLYPRINRRVEQMREEGLEQEVLSLKKQGYDRSYTSMQGLGYKELLAAFDGECSVDEAFEKIKQETRHFAKRQFTWFRREKDVTWIDREQFTGERELADYCIRDLKDTGII